MQDLFRKFLDNHCSHEELKKLLSYFSNPENEVLLRKLINEYMTNNDPGNTDAHKTYSSADIFNEIKSHLINIMVFGDAVMSMI